MQRTRRNGHWVFMLSVAALFLVGSVGFAQSAESLSYTFTFEKPVVGTVYHGASGYSAVHSNGALTMGQYAGDPALPARCVQILLPPGKEVAEVSVRGDLYDFGTNVDLEKYPVFPYQQSMPIGEVPPAKLEMNEAIYGSSQAFPADDFGWPKTGYSRGYAIFSMTLFPVKYSPADGKLMWYTNMTVEITLKNATEENPFLRHKKSDEEWVKMLVCNPETATEYQMATMGNRAYPGGICDPADKYDYVIITTTQNSLDFWLPSGSTPNNWQSLMDKHLAVSGLNCTLVTMQQILAMPDYENVKPIFNDAPARIREFCKDAYQDWEVDYILVAGDDEILKSRLMSYQYESNCEADIYWNHLDNSFNANENSHWGEAGDAGFDLYGELFIGRLSCDEPQDVSNWMTKLFRYMDEQDRELLDNAAFYGGDTGWNCQGDDFVDYSAIKGTDSWLGPNPGADPYPSWIGFQYGYETWNQENPGAEFAMDVKWTTEPPNPGWTGNGTTGLRNSINDDKVTLISGIAHANADMSLDVGMGTWESQYHNTFPFFIHDFGCHCGDMNASSDGVLHSMLFHSDTELAFGCVYHTGYGWGNFDNTCSSSSFQQKSFWDYMFDVSNNSGSCQNWQLGKAQAFSKDFMAPTIDWDPDYGTWRGTIEMCLLFSDPALLVKPPAIPELYLTFPYGKPEGLLLPGTAHTIQIEISAGEEALVPGTEKLHYRYDPADPYTEVALTSLGGDLYEGTLPETTPSSKPQYYFSAQGDGGTMCYAPWKAPADTYTFSLGISWVLMEDDCEVNNGWTIESVNLQTGEFELADPLPTDAQPGNDHSPNGTKCFVTDGRGGSIGDYDVDGGPTRLTTPNYDLSSGDAVLKYWVWHHDSDGGKPLVIDITAGLMWVTAKTVGATGGWKQVELRVSDYINPTGTVKVRFSSQDQPNEAIVETCVDDVTMERLVSEEATLWANGYEISAATGAVIDFSLDAGAGYAGRQYLMLGTVSGTFPGFTLPGGGVLPINWDVFTDLTLIFANTPVCDKFMGVLDGSGAATATLNTFGSLDPAVAGLNAHFAYLLGNPFDFVSNPIPMTFNP